MRNLETWQSVSAINTAAFNDQGSSCDQSYHSVLADFSTGEVELYSNPGFLRLVPRTKTASEVETDTPLTWQGIPVIDVPESTAAETDGAIAAPRLLRRFDDVEVLLHHEDRAWTFSPDGPVDKEWTFDVPAWTVFPDGAGGIVYQDSAGFYDPVNNSSIRHLNEPGRDSKALVDCTGDCIGLWLAGVAYLGGSAEVVYTVDSWPPLPEDAEHFYPTRTEMLHRIGLETLESASLVRVGGHEWGFGGKIVGTELRGVWSTEAYDGLVSYDLESGSVVCGTDWLEGFIEGESMPDCLETQSQSPCPYSLTPFDDGIASACMHYAGNSGVSMRVYIVSTYDRSSQPTWTSLPLNPPSEQTNIHSIAVWGSTLVINTLTREGYPGHRTGGFPHHAILIDLESQEIELYSHPGVLRLTPRAAHDSVKG